jgi:hypothetical protein
VDSVLERGLRTPDLLGGTGASGASAELVEVGTEEMTRAVIEALGG